MRPNIVLIVCDTLRKDVLSLYGGEARTPNINALAKESMVYDNCIAPSPWTFPSHVSLFTGMYLSEHGVHETRDKKTRELTGANLKLKVERLAEYLRKRDYTTLGFSNNIMISKYTGFDKGFGNLQMHESSPWIRNKVAVEARSLGSDIFQVAKELSKRGRLRELFKFGLEYLKVNYVAWSTNYPMDKGAMHTNAQLENTDLDGPFFLFINYFEVHEPYRGFNDKETEDNLTGIKSISKERVAFLKRQYVLETEYLDERIGDLIRILKRKGVYDSSMIMITSDHGQAFNEHGFMYHGIYLYDELSRVPLIVKYPNGRKFRKRNGYQSLASVFDLVKSVLNGGTDSPLTTKAAFTEAFGNTERPPESYRHRMWYINEKYEKVRKAVYEGNNKLTYNISDGLVEEFMNGQRASGNQKVLKRLMGEIKKLKDKRD